METLSTVAGFWDNATALTASADYAAYIIHFILTVLMFTVLLPMFYFLYKYSSKRHPKEQAESITHNITLELAWTIIPTLLLMVIFYYGFIVLKDNRTMPTDAKHIKVLGKMWSWSFEYPNGKKTDKLYVPQNQNIILDMTAPKNDVIHSFWIPAFRQKEDVVPGRITNLWFNATRLGEYDVECTEYCGDRHSYMLSKVVVIPKNEYYAWLDSNSAYPGGPDTSSEPIGKTLLANNGCTSCHSMGSETLVGPGFKGIVGRSVKTNNGTLTSNRAYLKDAILSPDKDVVDGFPAGMMPPSAGVLSEEQVNQIIDYLSTNK
jgi:cytochrome c oxidase subunit 2